MCCPSSSIPYLLSLASIFLICGVGVLTVGFATDNWVRHSVDREHLKTAIANSEEQLGNFHRHEEYFTRTRGLWNICFMTAEQADLPTEPYGGGNITLTPVDKPCRRLSFALDPKMTNDETTRIHLMRLSVGLFAGGFFLFLICFITGLVACWRRGAAHTLVTGLLVFFAALFCAAGVAVFHGYEHMELFELKTPNSGFKTTWSPEVVDSTTSAYWWSYIVVWVGDGLCIIAAFLFWAAHSAMRAKKRDTEKQNHYLVPVYPMDKTMSRGGTLALPPPPPAPMYYDKRGAPVYDTRGAGGAYVYSNQAYTAPQYGPYYYGHK